MVSAQFFTKVTHLSFIFIIVVGYLAGVAVNLIADYAPTRRYHLEARRSPFASPGAAPPMPRLFPNGSPLHWSGISARLGGQHGFASPRWPRRIVVELITPALFLWIYASYADSIKLPFYLFFGAGFILIAVIDIERRWVLDSVLGVIAIVGVVYVYIAANGDLRNGLTGAAYGLAIALIIYVMGMVFGQGLGVLRGRAVGRTVFGFGDVKLAALGGLLVGWPGIGFAFLITAFVAGAGALIVIANRIVRKRRTRRPAAIPYAPYLAFGIALVLYLPWLVGDFMFRLRR